MLPFVGVDGEGGDIPNASGFTTHTYTMLRAGRQVAEPDGTPDWHLRLLADLPKKQIHVAYFFDYDVTMMLRDLPETLLGPLVSGQEIYWGDYRLSYRPRKELRIKRFGKVTTINDVGTFFQSPFLTALQRWDIGTPQGRCFIAQGKADRSNFGPLTPETRAYNELECRYLELLATKFRRTCEVIGYLPTRWQGPGQLAKAMFKKHGIPRSEDLPEPPPGVWEMAQAAYYGGRFETSVVGPVRGPVEQWDINSAYPHAATLLPCLTHGKWHPTRSVTPNGMYRVSFTHGRELPWYSLPVRAKSGAIRYPRAGSGWYHGCELLSGVGLGLQFRVMNGWELTTDCDCRLFDFMWRLYSIRQGLGKGEAGMALKLAMNSAYGVLAQSVGAAPYANPYWAGLITALTRARLNEAIAIDPEAVYMVATDGLFTRADYPLVAGPGLGGWENTPLPDGMHIVQPGVYFGAKQPKTRGVPLTAILREEKGLRNAWSGKATDGLPIPLRQFVGLRLAVARGALHAAGQWLPVEKRISYDWSTKRDPRHLRDGRTRPYPGDPDTWTVPYDRHIGGNLIRDMDRLEWADTPDWAETLTEHL